MAPGEARSIPPRRNQASLRKSSGNGRAFRARWREGMGGKSRSTSRCYRTELAAGSLLMDGDTDNEGNRYTLTSVDGQTGQIDYKVPLGS